VEGNVRDSSKHALVDREEQIRNLMATNRRRRKDISESNVVEVSDELASGVGKGEREAPEEPLEGCYACGHHRQPDQ